MVARTEKRKVGNLAGYQIHVDRKTENHENKDIDNSKTYLNYDLVGHDKTVSFHQEFMGYIEQNKTGNRATRKDAVVLQDWIIGSSQDFFNGLSESETRKYFETAVEFFGEKFGRENIRFATVHMDEQTPHMHMGIVPMKDGKLSAKTIFDRNALRMVQDQLPKKFQEAGFDIQRGTPKSEQEHIHPETYKKQMKKAKNEAYEITERARQQANQIYDRREKFTLRELYENWHDDWLETKSEHPNFVLNLPLDDVEQAEEVMQEYGENAVKHDIHTDKETGILVDNGWFVPVDEDTPQKFNFDFDDMIELFQEKFKELKAYIAHKWQNLTHREQEIEKRENKTSEREKRLETKIGAFNDEVEKFQNTVELYNDTSEKILKSEPNIEMLKAVEYLDKVSPGLTGNKSIKPAIAKEITEGFRGLREAVEIQRKYIKHLEFENKRLKEPDKYMTFEDRIKKAQEQQKQMQKKNDFPRHNFDQHKGRSI